VRESDSVPQGHLIRGVRFVPSGSCRPVRAVWFVPSSSSWKARRGRAALQRRVRRTKRIWALAPDGTEDS